MSCTVCGGSGIDPYDTSLPWCRQCGGNGRGAPQPITVYDAREELPIKAYTPYELQPPSNSVREDLATEARYQAQRLADHGVGKVARVRIEVEFGDGSIVAHETKRSL